MTLSRIPFGSPNEIPLVEVKCKNDEWENMIRTYGVVNSAEWFGYAPDSEFTKETIRVLMERSGMFEEKADA